MGRRFWSGVLFGFLVVGMVPAGPVNAAAVGSVVINEVAWAGSVDSGSDEWIELYNTTAAGVDLSGWTIEDDGSSVYVLSGVVAAGGYFVIEDSEAAVQPAAADVIVNMSLANSGDSLVLKDDLGQVIDTVNSSGGAWFAGDSGASASMERIDALVAGDDPLNWVTSDGSGSTATASGGSLIVGTPGIVNSASVPPVLEQTVTLFASDGTPDVGSSITVNAALENGADLFSYGFEISYDPAVLQFVSAGADSFLSESGAVSTSFQYGLEDGQEGTLLVAEARTIDPKVGVSGDGDLFSATFNVIGGASEASAISFGAGSFVADPNGDTAAQLSGVTITPQLAVVNPVTNLVAAEGANRYEIDLSWDSVVGVDGYKIYRKDGHGSLLLIGQTTNPSFTDKDGVIDGGFIVPFIGYEYEVTAYQGATESLALAVTGMESRGLTGDNDRSDRVDGRDLDNLARHFAETDVDANFDPLVDTTYDAIIDGSDLIDLGANFALTYTP